MKSRKKSRFRIVKLEERITPNLSLPSGGSLMDGFDNQAPGYYHPNFYRSGEAIDATAATADFNPAVVNVDYGNEGPWTATFVSDSIDCTEC